MPLMPKGSICCRMARCEACLSCLQKGDKTKTGKGKGKKPTAIGIMWLDYFFRKQVTYGPKTTDMGEKNKG